MEIVAKDIDFSIGSNDILKGVSIKAHENEFIGVIGPNGSGKSTFLKCIYRVLKPNNGCIMIDNETLDKMSMKESAKKMAVVSQHNYYNFDFSVEEVVLMGRSPHKKRLERDNVKDYEIVRDSLEKVGMLDFRKRSFSTLSGGEQQRVILARALAQQTKYLILDEPTNHLDIKYQIQLLNIVKESKLTTIAAIHDLNIAAMYCDKLYVIKDGEVIAFGTPRDVLTKEFIKEVYEVDAEIIEDSKGQIHILYSK